MKEITLKISGRIPSKKNSLRRIKRGGRVFTVSSAEYSRWESSAVMNFARQVSGMVIKLPIMEADVFIDITFPDRRRSDLSNKAEGLMDALVKARVLHDDNWTVVRRLHLQALGSDPVKAGAIIRISVNNRLVKESESKIISGNLWKARLKYQVGTDFDICNRCGTDYPPTGRDDGNLCPECQINDESEALDEQRI